MIFLQDKMAPEEDGRELLFAEFELLRSSESTTFDGTSQTSRSDVMRPYSEADHPRSSFMTACDTTLRCSLRVRIVRLHTPVAGTRHKAIAEAGFRTDAGMRKERVPMKIRIKTQVKSGSGYLIGSN